VLLLEHVKKVFFIHLKDVLEHGVCLRGHQLLLLQCIFFLLFFFLIFSLMEVEEVLILLFLQLFGDLCQNPICFFKLFLSQSLVSVSVQPYLSHLLLLNGSLCPGVSQSSFSRCTSFLLLSGGIITLTFLWQLRLGLTQRRCLCRLNWDGNLYSPDKSGCRCSPTCCSRISQSSPSCSCYSLP
jgi:hypothetical protein